MTAITIVIPTFNGLQVLKPCLISIAKQTLRDVDVIVVDNGSDDGTAAWVVRHHPNVRKIRFSCNRGFSVAVNAGIRMADSPYVFLLNNDTELHPACLEELLNVADANEAYASFAPKMLQYDHRCLLDGAGDGVVRGGVGYRIGNRETDGPRWDHARWVFGACAGAGLYRRTFFEQVGLFDDDFFAYLEDVDINIRAARLGLDCLFVPGAIVYHRGSYTSGSRLNPFTVRQTTQNMVRVVVQNYPLSILFRQWPVILLHQFGWLGLMTWRRQFSGCFEGMMSALGLFPFMLKKRRAWKNRKSIPDHLFWEKVIRSEKAVLASVLRRESFPSSYVRWVRRYQQCTMGGISGDDQRGAV